MVRCGKMVSVMMVSSSVNEVKGGDDTLVANTERVRDEEIGERG